MNNKLQLDKLIQFGNVTFDNYKKSPILTEELQDKINKISILQTQNEANNLFKYNFVSLHEIVGKNLIASFDPQILLNPMPFKNNEKNKEWGYMLHAFLLILHDDYLSGNNYIKSNIFKLANETYSKNIEILEEPLNVEFIQKIANITGINLVIIDKNINIYKNVRFNKWIVLIKLCNQYFPLFDYDSKHFKNESNFVTYIQTIGTVHVTDKLKKKKEVPIEQYEEVPNNNESVPFISEKNPEVAVNHTKPIDKKKNNKKIFITVAEQSPNKQHEQQQLEQETKNNIKKEIAEFLQSIKPSTKLEKIQEYAIKANIPVIHGTTKEGKPKNRTKQDLLQDLEKYNNV